MDEFIINTESETPISLERRLKIYNFQNETDLTKEDLAKKWFKNILSECVMKEDKEKYPNCRFLFLNDKSMIEQNTKTKCFYISYKYIWSVFESVFGYNHQEIRDLYKPILEQHFKCEGFTTKRNTLFTIAKLEQHFKCEVFTNSYNY